MTTFSRSSPPLAALRGLLSLVVLAMAATGAIAATPAGSWEITKINGHDYVSVDSIKKFYSFTKMTRNGGSLMLENSKVLMKLTVGGNECLMNNVKFVFSEPISTIGDKAYVSRTDLAKLVDPVMRPSFIPNAGDFKTVVLDPGHGGKDAGATNSLGHEADYTLKVAGLLKKQLQAKGYRVIMTRESDVFISLQERVDIANAVKESAIYVSIHFNNSDGRTARGIETFTLSPPGVAHYGRDFKDADNITRAGNEHDSENIALATAVHGTILRMLGKNTLDRGIKRARFSVLSGVRHPAILFEGGFVSHPYEARLIANETYQNALANGICNAITKYRVAVSRPATNGTMN